MSKTNKERYEEYDEAIWEKVVFDEDSAGYVVVHQHHGRKELIVNLPIALQLAKLGFRVELLAEIKTVQSADATVDDEHWEFKTIVGTKSSVQNRLREGKYQSSNILLHVQQGFVLVELLRGLMSSVHMDRKGDIEKVGLLFMEQSEIGRLVLSRDDIKKMNFKEIIKYFPQD